MYSIIHLIHSHEHTQNYEHECSGLQTTKYNATTQNNVYIYTSLRRHTKKIIQMSMKTSAHNLDKKYYVTLDLGISVVLFHW